MNEIIILKSFAFTQKTLEILNLRNNTQLQKRILSSAWLIALLVCFKIMFTAFIWQPYPERGTIIANSPGQRLSAPLETFW